MRLRAAIAMAVLFTVSSCEKGTTVAVTVTSATTLAVDSLEVTAVIGTVTRTIPVQLNTTSIPPAHTFAIQVADSYSGMITVTVVAKSASDEIVGNGIGTALLVHNSTVDIDIPLTASGPQPDGGIADLSDMSGLDLTGADATIPCGTATTACSGNTLVTTCSDSKATTMETCGLGCQSLATSARCYQIVPSGIITVADVYATDLASTTTTLPSGTIVFDTSTGAITAGATTIRSFNPGMDMGTAVSWMRHVDPATGIGFRVAQLGVDAQSEPRYMAIWTFHGLKIPANATVYFAGVNAVGLVATTDMDIEGPLSLFPYNPTAGTLCDPRDASPGGGGANYGQFPGSGKTGNEYDGTSVYWGGGGGGGFGEVGGAGGYVSTTNPGSGGGASYGMATLNPIIGGSGGGWAQDELSTNGGAGGGAIQIVTGSSLTVGGSINAGGCGGYLSGDGSGPGGGGSGGAILVETPMFTATSTAVFAVNGGGGGAGGCAASGKNGQPSATPAAGGACPPANGAPGGAGGVTGAGAPGTVSAKISVTYFGSGGGGGVGRMRFNAATTSLSTAVFSPPMSATAYTSTGMPGTQ